MPGMDGTGPQGLGPGTGRGRGPCGAGVGRGLGYGRGFRRFGRGRFCRFYPYQEQVILSKEEEKKVLEQETADLELELKRTKERIKELNEQK